MHHFLYTTTDTATSRQHLNRCLLSQFALLVAGFIILVDMATCRYSMAESATWEIGTDLYYSTGNYGEDESTDMIYLPVMGKRFFPWGEISLTIPYIFINSPGDQVIIDGSPEAVLTSGQGKEKNSGLGDITAKAKYEAHEQEGWWPWIDVFARIKIPTASREKGLGSGEADLGFGIEMVYMTPSDYIAFLDIGFTFIGEPENYKFDNRWTISPGVGRYVHKNLLIAGFYEWRRAINPAVDAPQSLSFMIYTTALENIRAYTMLDLGLSDGSPDLGLSIGLSRQF